MPKCLNKTTASKFSRLVNCTVTPKAEASHKGVVAKVQKESKKLQGAPSTHNAKVAKGRNLPKIKLYWAPNTKTKNWFVLCRLKAADAEWNMRIKKSLKWTGCSSYVRMGSPLYQVQLLQTADIKNVLFFFFSGMTWNHYHILSVWDSWEKIQCIGNHGFNGPIFKHNDAQFYCNLS